MKIARTVALMAGVAVSLAGCKSQVEEAVKHELIDSESAQFREIERCTGDAKVYRGEVNAKNRMGAYVGFEPFFYDGISVAFAGNPAFEPMMKRCYPKSATSTDTPTDAATPPMQVEPSHWVTGEDINPVDDTKTRRAFLLADEGESSTGNAISLTIRCQSNETELYVNWNDYLGDDSHDVYDDWKNVTVRVGAEEAATQQWTISTDSNATFAPDSPVALIRRMVKADRLVLQTTPYNENPVTAVFQLKGMERAIAPIAQGCGWKL